ncbi:DUF4065 domain-containing protein [Stenotrophomonas maltophilia]|nr:MULTISPECIES: type II toxin-antitoxin system antitoxin SocA domain-containing protein [Stenotrophomonas]ELC7323539.1 DUF4065 domain-containing protein [Stenotrophomonas maltophilia]MBA0277292.1 DUF4065 domain-containing protein [Stenotrophomonas maltophilia]MBA0412655.1 DUF4065 domain-containing protein [Stenotrophomonas maltophilia]MBA0498020.1 DUF4065 domain-containing protein [Stenotrophomonas maltophilia]MBA0503150.1 DUF4065 domain-containing protein [Stenotrophomonas maltophilia]
MKGSLMYDSRAVANTVLECAENRGLKITNLSLQKIMYFCHGWHMVVFGSPLIRQEFEAWQYGPVLQNLYREFKGFERKAIDGRCTQIDLETGARKVVEPVQKLEVYNLIDSCVCFYGALRPGTLVEMSHDPAGPWHDSWNYEGEVNPGMRMPNERIHEYFMQVTRPF